MSGRKHVLNFMCWMLLNILVVVQAYAQAGLDSASLIVVADLDGNVIQNNAPLDRFYENLYNLKSNRDGVVSIVHIGDSHIQADFLTEVIRKNLQQEFGNAGRGLVVPARVAGTNEPLNIRSFSNHKWESKRVVHPHKPLPIGIGGITISSPDDRATFTLKVKDIDYQFNKIKVFHSTDTRSYGISLKDSLSNEIASVSQYPDPTANVSHIALPSYYHYIRLQNMRGRDEQNSATFFGLSLENGRPGVLYHAIGVNSARYEHYTLAKLFFEQSKELAPQLIIISLGTNESVEYPKVNPLLATYIQRLVERLQKANPDAVFVLVTPSACFLKKVKPNPGVQVVRNYILQYAVENGVSFYDMYKVLGGEASADQWREKGLLRPDGIHFSREGYALQGKLLVDAIMKGYNEYVSNRHP